MDEQRFDDLMREAAPSFREPPPPPLEAMWAGIEREHFGVPGRQNPWQRWYGPIMGMAATLLLGIGIGRMTATDVQPMASGPVTAAGVPTYDEAYEDVTGPYRAVTSRYLGQAVALL